MDFSLSRGSVAFSVGGGTFSLTVGTSSDWSAYSDADWLSLGRDGSTLYITAEANDETTQIREAEVTVTADPYGAETVQVRQEAAATPVISISCGSSGNAIDSEGGSFVAAVKSNYDWSAALEREVEGWELDCDAASGRITVTAGPNSGDAVTEKVVVTAGNGHFSISDEFTVSQLSRADNPYFKFIGDWNIAAADCCYSGSWYGKEGVYASCSIREYSYPGELMTLAEWAFAGMSSDTMVYYPDEGTATYALGYLCGYMYSGGIPFYMYLVAFNEDVSYFSSAYELRFALSEDGGSIDVSGLDDTYPVVGMVGYYPGYGYVAMSGIPYCRAPLTLYRAEAGSSWNCVAGGLSLVPADALPDGIPVRLPDGFAGEVSSDFFLQSCKFRE